jgi:hypothetical protein
MLTTEYRRSCTTNRIVCYIPQSLYFTLVSEAREHATAHQSLLLIYLFIYLVIYSRNMERCMQQPKLYSIKSVIIKYKHTHTHTYVKMYGTIVLTTVKILAKVTYFHILTNSLFLVITPPDVM